MTKLIFAFIVLLSPYLSIGQNCDCLSNYQWVKKTFEENDAAFSYALESKGIKAYQAHNTLYLEKVKLVKNSVVCTELLYEWLTFFRKGHIAIRRTNQNESTDVKPKKKDIIKQFKDWEKLNVNLTEFNNYLSTKSEIDFEGVWISGSYKIGVKKVNHNFIGFIIEADGVYWTKSQVKFTINDTNSGVYYMKNHTPKEFNTAELLDANHLQLGDFILERADSKFESNGNVVRYYKAIDGYSPYFEKINEHTAYLRIPSFSSYHKANIDSVIFKNKAEILRTENLIIDLRNNGGGNDNSYDNLMPFLYTNPVSSVGVEYLSTPLNNGRMLDFITNSKYGFSEEDKIWAQNSYDHLSTNLGNFVNLDSVETRAITLDSIYKFPSSIGIIINEGNASTTEEFLLAAKQSKKVKLFGTTTMGVLDISNMYFVKSPSGEFELGYCLSRSLRIPEMTVDDKGIQPDFYIGNDIPKYDWIPYTLKIIEHRTKH